MIKKLTGGKSFILLFIIFVLGYYLRVLYLPEKALTFGYDQARDAFITQEIINGDLKILGPPASTPGLYHGVFYYYLLAPAYLLGSGSPIVAAYWIAIQNAFVVFIVWLLTYLFTKKLRASIISSILFAVSFEATQYATWLSNPTIGVWTVPLIYLGLWVWIDDIKNYKGRLKRLKSLAPVVTGIGFGLSIQAEIFLVYHLVPITIWLLAVKTRIKKDQIVKFMLAFFLSISTMILVELKFGFKSINGIIHLLTASDTILQRNNLGDFIVLYLNQIGKTFSNAIFPTNAGYGGILGLIMIGWLILSWKKKRRHLWKPFLATYILSHLPVVSLGGVSTPFLTVGIGVGVTILTGIYINALMSKKQLLAFVVVFILIVSNIFAILTKNKKGQLLFAIQQDMLLSKELEAIDYIYKSSDGEMFSMNTLTSPLWVNTTWSYLFDWYGEVKYGFKPEWKGRDQVGQPGDILEDASSQTKLHYFIKEPPQGIPSYYLESEQDLENQSSERIDFYETGELFVEKRIPYDAQK